tara:strand:+ start:184 stop:447 length:264 start_codon:yes stop_codon:yes gene_type:complete
MIGYRKMKSKGLWKLSRSGDDVVYTRKSFDKETGEEKSSKVRKITSKEVEVAEKALKFQIKKLQEDLTDLTTIKEDIKKQEAIVNPD